MDICSTDLQAVPALSEIPAQQLDWLCQHSTIVEIPPLGFLFERGSPIDKMYIVLEGELELKIQQGNGYKVFDRLKQNDITGFLPYSRATTALGFGQVTKAARFLVFEKKHIKTLTANHYELTAALVQTMTSRTREFTKTTLQNEKLMALGKLSAGLAHELNNPSSAMVSSAKELKKQLGAVPDKFKRVMLMRATEEEVELVNDIIFEAIGQEQPKLSFMQKSELEEEIEDFLEENGVNDAFRMAETLADFNINPISLERIRDGVKQNAFATTIEWLENVLTTEKLVEEIEESANRISSLITSVKGYSHMDRSHDKERMDVAKSLDNTLTILNHKIKKKQIQVDLELDQNLPSPEVMIGEINQVWTNILDNAIDAVDQGGQIGITSSVANQQVVIHIKDNGKGIPKENLTRIFEPFFTTKKIGEGTGLGLDVSYRIVAQHGGEIEVSSSSEGTTFSVSLPINK